MEKEFAQGNIPGFAHVVTEAGLLDAAELDAIEREVEEATLAGLAAAPPDPAKTLTRAVYKTYA